MKAKEFIKKHGWNAVISAVKSTTAEETVAFKSTDLHYLDDENPMLGFNVKSHAIPYFDVKKYTDAYELVQLHGSLKLANHYAMKSSCLRADRTVGDLWEAIQLVESVDEND